MIKVTTALLSEILNAKLIGDATAVIDEINTDSRQYQHNSLFFALKGENFDAHDYLDKAISQGAIALVVERADYSLNVPQLVVANSRLALGDLAKWLRNKINPRTVAMTGSSGKTTVKEMTASILIRGETIRNPVHIREKNRSITTGMTLMRTELIRAGGDLKPFRKSMN